jgi:hypothetical protein
MTGLVLSLLKVTFISFLFLFVWQIAKSVTMHLGSSEARTRRQQGSEIVFVRSDTQAGIDFPVHDVVVLGRSENADVLLEDPYASEFHLRFTAEEGGIVLHDLGSTNGTYVNGRRVSGSLGLNRGDAIQVGKTVMEVR